MIPKFRAWSTDKKIMAEVRTLRFTDELVETDKFVERSIEGVKLMQSTGLLDKNGKEIFEGDIIKCTRGCLHEVYLEKEYGGTYIGGMPAIYLKGIREGYAWTGDEKIIGNIYENPELLEVTG